MSNRIQIKASESPPATADLVLFSSEETFITRPLKKNEFDGSLGSSSIYHSDDRREIYIGMGKAEAVTPNTYRLAAAHGIRKGISTGSAELALDVSGLEEFITEIAGGLTTGSYCFDNFRAKKQPSQLKKITLVGPKKSLKGIRDKINRGIALGDSTNYTRHLGNLPGNHVTPETLAREARMLAEKNGLKCKVWSRTALAKEGFGGLLAVGGGSSNEPRLIRMDYTSGRKNAPTVVVVGKAITFDSGGICIKSADHMDEMKFDKMGGCSVLGILRAVGLLKPDFNVIGILAAAENMTGPAAFRPGDIVRTFDGKTIEVANTDAEGRIVLADALGYVREKIRPDLVIDLATLTGACVMALGEERAGLFCLDSTLALLLQDAGEKTGERVWPLPFCEEFDSQIDSEVADVRNLGKTRWGGASTAATFLSRWTQGLPHIHLDIAGPAMNSTEKYYRSPGATGFGVNLIYSFAESWSRSSREN